jgi:GWxTD domain-containing protein
MIEGIIEKGVFMALVLSLLSFFQVLVDCYRFDEGYVEVWYQIPLAETYAFSQHEFHDTTFIHYVYRFTMYEVHGQDSSSTTGVKGAYITAAQREGYLIDYIPITLYPGTFHYVLEVELDSSTLLSQGTIEIPPDTLVFDCSDILLGKRSSEALGFHNAPLLPSISSEFLSDDTLFSYIELYGLVPDSLHYTIHYLIIDSAHISVLDEQESRLKYAYSQIDTFTAYCNDYIDGLYTFMITVTDPASNTTLSRSKLFHIRSLRDNTAELTFYDDIQYIVDPAEFKRFEMLSQHQKDIYLKQFWKDHEYAEYEKRITNADGAFSTRSLLGRNTERGFFYIKHGPPDEIEVIPMAGWARPFEVWHYYRDGYDVLFCDVKDDGKPRFMKIFRAGELIEIIEHEYFTGEEAEEEWIFDLGPGTYDHIRKEGAEF